MDFKDYLYCNIDLLKETNLFISLDPERIIRHKTKSEKTPNDIHLYEVFKNTDGHYVKESCCGQFNLRSSLTTTKDKEKDEQEMREYAAKAGRKMCGVCVSHLYSNTDTSEK